MVAIRVPAIFLASLAALAGATAIPEAAPESVAVEARAGPTKPCTMWIPQFGVNTVFIKGKKATVKWDKKSVPDIVCPISKIGLVHRDNESNFSAVLTNGSSSTELDPRAGSWSFTVPKPKPNIAEYLMTFDLYVDGTVTWGYPVLVSDR